MSKNDGGGGKKKRGMSADEKKRTLLQLYHEKSEPFNIKELENLGSKAGIVQQTIKDVNQSLLDDSLICQDKIGTGNIFWSFPVKTVQEQTLLRDQYIEEKTKLMKINQELQEKITIAQSVRVHKDRKEKIRKLDEFLSEEKELDQQLQEMKANDPDVIIQINKQCEVNKAAVNRWTDNIWAVKSYLTKKKGMSAKDANTLLKIDQNFDYLE